MWEIVRARPNSLRRHSDAADAVADDDVVRRTARLTGLTQRQVRTALRYYAEHPDEIDDWIQRLDKDAAQAEAAWDKEHAPPIK